MATLELRDTVSFVTIDWLPSCIAERKLMPTTQFEVNELEKNIGLTTIPAYFAAGVKSSAGPRNEFVARGVLGNQNNMEDKNVIIFPEQEVRYWFWVLGLTLGCTVLDKMHFDLTGGALGTGNMSKRCRFRRSSFERRFLRGVQAITI